MFHFKLAPENGWKLKVSIHSYSSYAFTGLTVSSHLRDTICLEDCAALLGALTVADLHLGSVALPDLVLQKVPSEFHPKVRNHGEGPY